MGHVAYAAAIAASLRRAPIVGVVRCPSLDEARRHAAAFIGGGIELIEITFTVPRATSLVEELLAGRGGSGPPWIGMGTVTGRERAAEAIAAGAEFVVSPNASPAVADETRRAERYLVIGALTPTEIVTARDLGADLVKVYPLPPVGGPGYLEVVRQPLGDIPMLAGGGFGIEEIPAYRAAGASAFGIGAPLLGDRETDTVRKIRRALRLARGEDSEAA
jgi:2-dehydro-3-deoxyphosphogluconate aldolase/(4S)-4-hydroxy-2-oxoglutarate aldolase